MSRVSITREELVEALSKTDPSVISYGDADRVRVLNNPNLQKFIEQIRKTGEEMIDEPIVSIAFSKFRLFAETGDRNSFETSAAGGYYNHRKFLVTFGLLSWLYGEERYIKKLEDAIWAICDEYSWCLPAHMGGKSLERLEPPCHTVDLFASETGSALAEIIDLMGDKLSPIVVERAKYEVNNRIVSRVFEPFNFKKMTNNWSAVCANNVLLACTYLVKDNEQLADIYIELLKCVDVFLSGFPKDGCCLEGVGYWNYGFGNFINLAYTVRKRTGGAIDLFEDDHVLCIARFAEACYFPGGRCVSFSDSGTTGSRALYIASKLAEIYPEHCTIDSLCVVSDYPKGGCWCFSTFFRKLVWSTDRDPSSIAGRYGTYKLPYAQWYISTSDNGVSFACKAGHNGEAHNHNDVGSFLMYKNGAALLLDIGPGDYSKFYFSGKRYEMYYCAASRGHSVPLINGQEQKNGVGYAAKDTVITDRGITADIAGAYAIDGLDSLVRSFDFGKDGALRMVDEYSFSEAPSSVVERFITLKKPEILEDRVLIANGQEQVSIYYDHGLLSPTVFSEDEVSTSGRVRTTYRVDFELMDLKKSFKLTFDFK